MNGLKGRTTATLVAVALAGAVLVSGCGSSSDTTSSEAPAPATSPEATTSAEGTDYQLTITGDVEQDVSGSVSYCGETIDIQSGDFGMSVATFSGTPLFEADAKDIYAKFAIGKDIFAAPSSKGISISEADQSVTFDGAVFTDAKGKEAEMSGSITCPAS